MECMVLGGDKRFVYLADFMRANGYSVYEGKTRQDAARYMEYRSTEQMDTLGHDTFKNNLLLILPVPVAGKDDRINGCEDIGLSFVIDHISSCSFVCGGMLPQCITDVCVSLGIPYYDYMKDDEVACKNAVATAEGAIAEAFMMSKINIDGSKCLVTGYGRCAKVLAEKLALSGASVTITARSAEACLHAEFSGYHSIPLASLSQSDGLAAFDYCFNTIPALVITKPLIDQMRTDLVLIDIASKPGGCNFEALARRGICYLHSLGIPGRYSPKTSGEILGEGIRCRASKLHISK